MDPFDRIRAYCAANCLTLEAPLAGGQLSEVHLARTRTGTAVVVKSTCRGNGELASEAEWLLRHPSAPQVLDLRDGVLVLSHLDAAMLTVDPPTFDLQREAGWLATAAAAVGPAHPADEDVRGRYRTSYLNVVDRDAARPWRRDLAEQWMEWADSADGSSWQSVPFDVICKNTLVDPSGCWWAIDPMCVRAPLGVLWCPWMIDRAHRSFGLSLPSALEMQEALLETSPEPAVTEAWMPGALMWTLWWAHPGHERHRFVLDLIDYWLCRWEVALPLG